MNAQSSEFAKDVLWSGGNVGTARACSVLGDLRALRKGNGIPGGSEPIGEPMLQSKAAEKQT
jgi:hypothetical protein